ncbi:MAG: hypothetical protein ACYC6G_20040 [Desulfobaccales bacterium]
MGNELTITLKINSQGEAVIKQVTGDFEKAGQAGQKALGDVAQNASQAKGQLDGVLTSLDSQAARWISIAGASYLAYKAYSSWFSLISGGIATVDDYQKKVISTSYILATMSEVPATDLSKTYGQWKEYFAWLYQQSLYADKQAAASAQDIFAVSVELAKKGVVAASEEEILTISRLTDLMKAVTPGYMNFEQQARGEIMSMMEGTARMGAQTAQILSQIDPEFKKNIASAREQGTVLQYIESILPQIKQYTLDLMGTWDAVGASLKSAWAVINLKAFGDAHREVVELAAQLGNRLLDNGKLTADGEKLALALGQAWATAKTSISEALDYVLNNSDEVITDIKTIASATGTIVGFAVDSTRVFMGMIDSARQTGGDIQVAMVQVRAAINYTIEWFSILGMTAKEIIHDVIYNFWGFSQIPAIVSRAYADMEGASKRWAETAVQDANNVRFAIMNAMQVGKKPAGFVFMGGEAEPASIPQAAPTGAPPTPPVRPFTGKEPKGKGAGAEDAEARRLMSLYDTLTKDIARLSEGRLAEVNANLEKTIDQIYSRQEIAVTNEAELEVLARTRAALQKQKIEEDYQVFVGKESGNTYLEIEAQAKAWLDKYKGIKGAEQDISDITARKKWEADINNYVKIISLDKSFYDQAAQNTTNLIQQIYFKRMALNDEIEAQKYQLALQLNQLVVAEQITSEERDRRLANQALLDQQKRFNFEMENNKGLSGWAYARVKSDNQKNTISDLMGGLESGLQSSFSSAWQGFLTQDKKSLAKAGQSIFQGILGEINKGSITKLFSGAAQLAAPKPPDSMGSGTGLTPYTSESGAQLSKAAAGLNQASVGFNANTVGFNANTAQFGLAAGGLLLSGVGIATNSQFLVIAGTVLQVAGLAIQIYQALAGVTQMGAATALTGAAGALSAAAGMLMAVSFKQSIPIIGHTGLELPRFHLGSDEIPAVLQKGEWVLNRMAVSALRDTYGPGAFKMFNSGQVPTVPVLASRERLGRFSDGGSERGGDTITHDSRQVHLSVGDIHLHVSNSKMTTQEVDNLVRKQFLPAINKQLKRFGFSIGG